MSKAQSTKIFGSLILALLVVAAWFLLLSPRMSEASEIKAMTESQQAANATTQSEIASLEAKRETLPDAVADANALAARFPATAAQGDLFAAVKNAAQAAGIADKNVTALTPSVPQIGGAADGSAGLPATEAPTDPATGAPAPPSAPSAPAAATGTLATMTVDATVSGSKAQLLDFLDALENMDRSYLVSTVTLGPVGDGPAGFSLTVSGSMYMLPPLVSPVIFVDAEGTSWTIRKDGVWQGTTVDGDTSASDTAPEGYAAP